MINISDYYMYIRYLKKITLLRYMKTIKGLDFTGRIASKNSLVRGYEGCYPVDKIMRKLNIGENDAILDIGCGKGLFLYYASKFKFKRIDGIEYDKKLVEVALKNAALIADERIHIYHCDARKYKNYGNYNYFFLNNPFSTELMEVIVIELKRIYDLNYKRKITVIYQFPFNLSVFIKNGFKIEYASFPNSVLTYG